MKKYLSTLLPFLFFCSTAQASVEGLSAPPEINVTDDNGINLLTGKPGFSQMDLKIGNGPTAMAHSISSFSAAFFQTVGPGDNYFGLYEYRPSPNNNNWSNYIVTFNGSAENYKPDFSSVAENGSTLTQVDANTLLNVKRDGTKITISTLINRYEGSSIRGVVTRVESPMGLITDIHYKTIVLGGKKRARIQSVVQNNGLQLKYNYASASISSDADLGLWASPTSIVAINNAVDYCNPTADSCTYTATWPTATYTWSGNKFSVLDQFGVTTSYTKVSDSVTNSVNTTLVEKSGAQSVTYRYANSWWFRPFDGSGGISSAPLSGITAYGLVAEVTKGSASWLYDYVTSSYGSDAKVTGPINQLHVTSDATFGVPLHVTRDGTTVNLEQSFRNRITNVQFAAGHQTDYGYDARGNLTSTLSKATGFQDAIQSANYDSSCSNPIKCNQPNYIIDALNNRTDFSYNSNGFLESITKPAGKNGIRPQTRYFYEQRRAWYKNASNVFVAGSPIWVLVRESFCKDGAASGSGCATASDEVIKTYDYGMDSGPNNLWLKGEVVTAAGKTLRTCYAYDIYGNKISETAPKANLTSCP